MAKSKPVPAAPAPPVVVPTTNVLIDMTPAPEAAQAIALRSQVTGMVVNDKPSHEAALTDIRRWKQLKRAIEDHWSKITRNVDELKRNLLDLKRKDLEPVDYVIDVATRLAQTYADNEARRVREETDRLRREAEQKAADDRARQLREQEERAAQLEADSPHLSNREQIFVEALVDGRTGPAAAQRAGYQDPAGASARLLASEKIQKAIGAKQEAIALRKQAEATRQQPLDVVQPQKVQSNVGKVAGIRNTTTWSAEVIDLETMRRAYMAGELPLDALVPNQVFLNDQARQLHEAFDAAYPGCRHIKNTGLAG